MSSNKALFYHLPKTAGRSIWHWLERELGPNVRWFRGGNIQLSEAIVTARWEDRRPALEPIEAKVIGGHDASRWHAEHAGWTRWKAYTVLREPAERIYSQYRHFARKGQMHGLGFIDWASGSNVWGLCYCLWCYYGEAKDNAYKKHKSNPIAWFYASRNLRHQPEDPYEAARDTLRMTNIWTMNQVGDVVHDLADYLGIGLASYKPFDVSGAGATVSREYRDAVRELHPIDYELWKEFGLRKR